jgi:hypothetical protein
MFRDTGDKLERHEYRERQLGEQLKKALVGLDKRHRTTDHSLDAIAQIVNRLDERLLNVEKMIAQASDDICEISDSRRDILTKSRESLNLLNSLLIFVCTCQMN